MAHSVSQHLRKRLHKQVGSKGVDPAGSMPSPRAIPPSSVEVVYEDCMTRPDPFEPTLDPEDWEQFRMLAREMVDTTVDDLKGLPTRHAWRPLSEQDKVPFATPLPREGRGLPAAYQDFLKFVKPFPFGQFTPRFWGWAGGTGTSDGVLASLLNAAFHSPNIIHHHAGTWVEMQVLEWFREAFAFPQTTKGNLTSGGSLANFIGLAVARHLKGGKSIRAKGVRGRKLMVYGSAATHYSIPKALDMLGLGGDAFRAVPVTDGFEIDLAALKKAVARDRKWGLKPIGVVGNAGTVGTGAIDPLEALADFASKEGLWFHVDGAIGATAIFSDKHRGLLKGIERADSLAFDLHKWLSQPYDVGCILVADGRALEAAFAYETSYTTPVPDSLTDSPAIFADRGPELSRALRGLPFWISMKTHGAVKFGQMVDKNIAQARFLEGLVNDSPVLELLASGPLSLVNFRYRGGRKRPERAVNRLNERLVGEIQKRGIAIPSLYAIGGKACVRVCNLNQRSQRSDFEALVQACEQIGAELEVRTG
jgi:aromatic-L-amino-acid decarboxylase